MSRPATQLGRWKKETNFVFKQDSKGSLGWRGNLFWIDLNANILATNHVGLLRLSRVFREESEAPPTLEENSRELLNKLFPLQVYVRSFPYGFLVLTGLSHSWDFLEGSLCFAGKRGKRVRVISLIVVFHIVSCLLSNIFNLSFVLLAEMTLLDYLKCADDLMVKVTTKTTEEVEVEAIKAAATGVGPSS